MGILAYFHSFYLFPGHNENFGSKMFPNLKKGYHSKSFKSSLIAEKKELAVDYIGPFVFIIISQGCKMTIWWYVNS